MKGRSIARWSFALWLGAYVAGCLPAPQPSGPSTPTPGMSASPTPSPSPSVKVSPTRPRSPSATPTSTPAAPRPIGLPDGFHTEGEWLAVFRPAVERQTWKDGAIWLTEGQRWIGPWLPNLILPEWIIRPQDGQLYFCHWFQESTYDDPPVCVTIPRHMRIQPYLGETRYIRISPMVGFVYGAYLDLCDEEGRLCFYHLSDEERVLSVPLHLPLPEKALKLLKQEAEQDRSRRDMRSELIEEFGCIDGDERHAVFGIDPIWEGSTPIFSSGLYWADLQSGEVLTAPTNAPTWPAQQALIRSLIQQGTLPPSFLPFVEKGLRVPSGKVEFEEVDGYNCSPTGKFMLVAQRILLPARDVVFPADAQRFGAPRGETIPVHIVWVLRLKDGVGYPITIRQPYYNQSHIIQWVYPFGFSDPSPAKQFLAAGEYHPPTYPLPLDFYLKNP